MPSAEKVVLVTGATGRQGGAVVRHMLARGWKLRALTRNTSRDAAQELARRGVEVVQGDLENAGSVISAAAGVYGIYSVQDSQRGDCLVNSDELRQRGALPRQG